MIETVSSSQPLIRERSLLPVALLGFLISAALMWSMAGGRLANALGDPDDALRLQQVRDLLFNGQGWYDAVQHRFNPPDGVLIHWSRLIDLPIAGMILLLKPFLGQAGAEYWTRGVWPTLPVLPLLLAMGFIARQLGGFVAAVIAILYGAVAASFVTLFTPGRIDHHNVQLALTLVLFACIMAETRKAAVLGGLSAAIMLAIGMETLPYSVLACVVLVLRWIVAPRTAPVMLAGFASLTGFALLIFVLTVSPARWREPSCDMISPVYLMLLAVVTATLAIGLANERGGFFARDWRHRLGLAVVAGVAGLLVVSYVGKACLSGPYVHVDPRLFSEWMNDVAEARSAFKVFRVEPDVTLAVLIMPFMALIAGLVYLVLGRAPERFSLAPAIALVAISFLLALWQIRAAAFAMMFALPVFAVLSLRLLPRLAHPSVRPELTLAVICALLNPLTLPRAGSGIGEAIAAARGRNTNFPTDITPCNRASDYKTLAQQPPGVIAAPVDIGAFIIVTTRHSAISAPYHRNSEGILDMIDLFKGADGEARVIARRHGAHYLAYCHVAPDMERWATGGAKGLEMRLERGEIPGWLEPVPLGDTPLRLYRIR